MRHRATLAATLLIAFSLAACSCGGDDEEASRLDSGGGDDDAGPGDDDDDDASPPGDPCTTVNTFYSGQCGDLPGWEQSPTNGCEGACFVMSAPEGNNQGYCVDACQGDGDCPDNWFCLPECPDIEGWFEIRWCIQNVYDFMRECPDA
jgi:hypothetical protein